MERHVAIVHGGGIFSSFLCEVCQGRYYDIDHFMEHLKTTAACSAGSIMVNTTIS